MRPFSLRRPVKARHEPPSITSHHLLPAVMMKNEAILQFALQEIFPMSVMALVIYLPAIWYLASFAFFSELATPPSTHDVKTYM